MPVTAQTANAKGANTTAANGLTIPAVVVSAGSNLALFIGVSHSGATPLALNTITRNGQGHVAIWDATFLTNFRGAGAYILNPTVGTFDVVIDLAGVGNVDELIAWAVPLVGVDQTTPVGTPATASSASGSPSATPGSVGVDDLLIDSWYTDWTAASGDLHAAGANQTTLIEHQVTAITLYQLGSSQSGADGGAMTWTFGGGAPSGFGSALGWAGGAVAFKPAAVVVAAPDTQPGATYATRMRRF